MLARNIGCSRAKFLNNSELVFKLRNDDLTFSDGILVREAAERGVGHTDELVQHHAGHVALREVGERHPLAVLELGEPEVLQGGEDDVVVGEHHALGVASGATGVDQGGTLVDGDAPQPGLEGSVLQAVTSAENVLGKSLLFLSGKGWL